MIRDIEEKAYRALPEDSSSSLKTFSTDRRKYRKRYILKEHVEEKDNDASNMGRLVETILMEPERFDDLFYMSSCVTKPTGLMGDFVHLLTKETINNIDKETGALKEDFISLAERAYEASGFKLKFEAVMKKFTGDIEIYYKESVNVSVQNLTIVTPDNVNNAEKIVHELKNNFVSSSIVNLKTNRRFEVINQLKISSFYIDGLEMKAMLDKVIVDHNERVIHIIDLKCTWNVEKFYKEYYLYRRSYIQGYVYYKAVQDLCKDTSSPWYGYSVNPPKFLVCDSINYYNPLIYKMSEEDLKSAYYGFEQRGFKYPGVKTIIEELKWAKENDIWNISKQNYENSGELNLEY